MRILNGPATVNGELPPEMPLVRAHWEGGGEAMNHESGDFAKT